MDNDIIDISFDDNWNNSSSSFGGGIELLMNDTKPDKSNSTNIDIEELDALDNELNDLNAHNQFESNLFSNDKPSVKIMESNNSYSDVGKHTANIETDAKTWDGYGKFNNIPINPDIQMSSEPKLSKDEMLREKFKYLRKLEALEKKGVELTKKYNMESNLYEMIGEYDMIMEEKTKQNSIKFQGNMMSAIINGIEFLNNRFDPFDVNLDGWSEQVNENITDYDDIFGELYEKYKSKATVAPELKLLMQLGGSAMMVHMSNTMFKSAMPGMDDILKQNPDLMHQFQQAAVNSMATTNPGLGGFMNSVMNDRRQGPPPTMSAQTLAPPPNRGGNNIQTHGNNIQSQRPDMSMARGNMFEDPPAPAQKSARRPDMKGPTDISNILSGLKTKTIEIANPHTIDDIGNNSTISVDDLKSIQSDGNVPKRIRRKKTDKNTVSLDI